MKNFAEFVAENGRFPMADKGERPWQYPGWLLAYVVDIQRQHKDIPDRWGYLLETVWQNKFLDQPIPQIKFCEEGAQGVHEIAGRLKYLLGKLERYGYWRSFCGLIDFILFGFGDESKSPEFKDEDQEMLYRELNIGPWLLHPYDHLGRWLAIERGSGWNPNAFYPTPHNVVEAMVSMQMHDCMKDGETRHLSVNDPCVGTGRMLLHASNYSMNLSASDIDPVVLDICKINGFLYAPWLVKRPAKVIEDYRSEKKKDPIAPKAKPVQTTFGF